MKIRRKPDLLTLLAVITLIGVLLSSLLQWYMRRESVLSLSSSSSSVQHPTRYRAMQLYRGNFIKVSSQDANH
jgi:hypothetical protein